MLVVKTYQNVPVSSNCYIVHREDAGNAIIVDPGSKDSSEVILYLNNLHLQPDYIILTHEHFDHIWGVEQIIQKYQCKLIASDMCSAAIMDPKGNLSVFYDQKGFSTQAADIIIDKMETRIDWRGYELRFFKTPGHTSGSICFLIDKYLFTGDTLLKDYTTVTKLPGGSKTDLQRSISGIHKMTDKIALVFPGHGEAFILNEMKKMYMP
jgi:hydroxyacylglutathione hydrolase